MTVSQLFTRTDPFTKSVNKFSFILKNIYSVYGEVLGKKMKNPFFTKKKYVRNIKKKYALI